MPNGSLHFHSCRPKTFQNSTKGTISAIEHDITLWSCIPWYGLNPKGRPSRSSAICKLRWCCHHWHLTSSSGGKWRHNWESKSSGSLDQNLVLASRTKKLRVSIDSGLAGAWQHTWLQGKPRITSPLSLYLSYRAWSPRYWDVNPLWVGSNTYQSSALELTSPTTWTQHWQSGPFCFAGLQSHTSRHWEVQLSESRNHLHLSSRQWRGWRMTKEDLMGRLAWWWRWLNATSWISVVRYSRKL